MKPLLVLALLFGLSCQAGTITGLVVGVADGDTVTVLDAQKVQHQIRLSGIDAPEKKQPFGNRSKESLSDSVFNKTLTVETDKKDRYGRDVGKVLVDGVDINLKQVQRGLAWHYKAYQREQSADDRQLYDLTEREAKAAQRGLWRDANPVAPWEFRKGNVVDKSEVKLPTTIDGAVRLLQSMVPQDEQARIAMLKEADLCTLHFGLGQWIRNNLDLWKGNDELVAATGESNADDASAAIIQAFWMALRAELQKIH